MMKGLIKRKEQEGFEYVDLPIPKINSDEILIKVIRVGICGSDFNLYKWNDIAKNIAKLPFTPGHETYGEVVEVGQHIENFKIGDKVCVENIYFCGNCFQCNHNQRNMCQFLGHPGHGLLFRLFKYFCQIGRKTDQGGCSQYQSMPARFAYKLTSDISPDIGALLEPLGVSHNGIEELEVKNEDVLIIGCGPIGLFALKCAQYMGANKIIMVDILEDKLKIAKQMGADIIINSSTQDVKKEIFQLTDNTGIGRIFESSGAPNMVNNCFQWLRKGGHVLLVGLPKKPLHVENVLTDVIFKSLTLKTIHGRKIYHSWEEIEKMVTEKDQEGNLKYDITPTISCVLPLSQFEKAFELLFTGKAIKILLDPQK